jgi:hypothetical protein
VGGRSGPPIVGPELDESVNLSGADQALTAHDRLAALLSPITDLSPLAEQSLRRRLRQHPDRAIGA